MQVGHGSLGPLIPSGTPHDRQSGAGGGAMAPRQRVHRQAPWPSGNGPSHTSQCCGKTPSSSTWSQRVMAERGGVEHDCEDARR